MIIRNDRFRKILIVGIMLLIITSIFCGTVTASNTTGPAPNSGDGIPDGSGFP